MGVLELLVAVSIIFLITLFFFDARQDFQGFPPTVIEREARVLSSQLEQAEVSADILRIYTRALSTLPVKGEEEVQYKALFNLAQGLILEYQKSHNPKLKDLIKDVDVFVKANYGDLYKSSDFTTPCSDEKCGKLVYPEEIMVLKKEIDAADLKINSQAIDGALYVAFLETGESYDKYRKVQGISHVIGLLETEIKAGNRVAKRIQTSLIAWAKKNLPDFVNPLEKIVLPDRVAK